MALRLLTARARTRAELEAALVRKHVPGEAIATVLDRFDEVGLINDEQFAADWVDSRRRQRRSVMTIRRELRTKGVADDTIDDAVSGVTRDDELSSARALAASKLRAMGSLDTATRTRRLAGVLGRRGFSAEIVWTVVREAAGQDDPADS